MENENQTKTIIIEQISFKMHTKLSFFYTFLQTKSTSEAKQPDSSLSGWRLLRLYRLWSNENGRPAWASPNRLTKKQEEAEQHANVQSRKGSKVPLVSFNLNVCTWHTATANNLAQMG